MFVIIDTNGLAMRSIEESELELTLNEGQLGFQISPFQKPIPVIKLNGDPITVKVTNWVLVMKYWNVEVMGPQFWPQDMLFNREYEVRSNNSLFILVPGIEVVKA